MHDKAVNTCCIVFYSVPNWYKTQEMCDIVVSKDPLMLIYWRNRYKTQKIDEAVDDSGSTKIYSWLVCYSVMLDMFHGTLLANDDILFFDKESSKVTVFANDW